MQDLFRCSTSLGQVLQPIAYEEQVRSLIDIWRFDGYLPDARSSSYNGRTQGGSDADNVLADAYVKGVRGAVNWKDGSKAMVKDAQVTPANYPGSRPLEAIVMVTATSMCEVSGSTARRGRGIG